MRRRSSRFERITHAAASVPGWAQKSVAITTTFLAGIAFTGLVADAQPAQDHVSAARDSARRAVAAHQALATLEGNSRNEATPENKAEQAADNRKLPALSSVKATPAPDAPTIKDKDLLAAAAAVKAVPVGKTPTDWVAAGLDISRAEEVDGKLVQTLPSGAKVTLTIDPKTQREVEKMYARYKIPYGGVALIEPSTGKVRALISQNHGAPVIKDVALKPIAPSASVFKVVTAAALVEGENISPSQKVCYHGGRSSLTDKNIEGDKRLDNRCGNLSDAVAWSINSLIAKLAYQNLSKAELEDWARRFGYNQEIPFELPVEVSVAEISDEPHERARTAAGFWNTRLSPLHGAMISAAYMNDGVMMQPTLIESYENEAGQITYTFEPRVWRRVMNKETAVTVRKMMNRTTQVGTARKYFRFRNEFPRDITTGGKTGTLSRKSPSYLGYTWFVGYGEANEKDGPQIAVGGLVCNKPLWHIKGPYAASEAIRIYIESKRDQITATAEKKQNKSQKEG
jgi:membrane carboxypeptidase/penicillin-binding protein